MKQKALYLATVAALALPGAALPRAALAAGPQNPSVRPPFHAPLPAFARHPQGVRQPNPHGKPYLRALVPFDSYGWPVVVPASDGRDMVTHDFVDPRFHGRPRLFPRSVEILSDEPVVFSQKPHIIEFGRHKRRAPIAVVRRGVISQE